MTAVEVQANLIAHGACVEGLAWSAGKDSKAIWASTDEFTAPYIFWWAVKNAGQSGWKPRSDILNTLNRITDVISKRQDPRFVHVTEWLSCVDPQSGEFVNHALHFYAQVEKTLESISEDTLINFRLEILPIVRELRPA